MTTAIPRYLSAGSSDQGYVRPNNEDRVYCDDARGIFLVVDGMGGHEAGEHAAEIALARIRVRLERQTDSVEQRLREAIALANNAIYEAAHENPEWNGMACVLTAAVIDDGQITVGHVGDSRLYRIKRGLIEKITHDHSPVGEREDSGELSEREAMQHPRRNEVYRDVGSQERTPDARDFIEVLQMPFDPDGALLLCSDGLSDAISSEEILRIIEENAGDRWGTVRALIAAANEVGKDNVSAVLVEGEAFAASFGKHAAAGESTGRMAPCEVAIRAPWYRSGASYLLYGVILGAALAIFLQLYLMQTRLALGAPALVVSKGETIAAALGKARAGDKVVVAPGTYAEAVELKQGVALIAQRAEETIIKGSVTADHVEHARLEGFKVRGAVVIGDSDVVIARDDISDAQGVKFTGNSRGAIFSCYLHSNAGGGILVTGAAAPAIENNVIEVKGDSIALVIVSTLRPVVIRNVFAGDRAEQVWMAARDETILRGNYFVVSGKLDEHPKTGILGVGSKEGRP